MIIDILTLFPNMFDAPLGESIIGRAQAAGHVTVRCHQIRDFTTNRQNQVDDYPYGGGQGCVMQAQPLHAAWRHAQELGGPAHTIYLSPRGKVLTQADAVRLAEDYERLILVCGHYEGIDQRFIDTAVDEEISIGDVVLTGGEIPAMALADAVCRLVPGVLSDESCFTDESHWGGLLEHPQYSRPEVWEAQSVPEVLKSGDHKAIDTWRRKQSFLITLLRRPDMFEKLLFSRADLKLLGELRDETGDAAVFAALSNLHTGRITVRKTRPRDLKGVQAMFRARGFFPADAEQYIETLGEQGITDYSIYADGHGYVGHCVYTSEGPLAQLKLDLLPHATGKGIDTFAVAFVLDELFAQPALKICVVADPLPADLVRRIGFLKDELGQCILARTDWLEKRGN